MTVGSSRTHSTCIFVINWGGMLSPTHACQEFCKLRKTNQAFNVTVEYWLERIYELCRAGLLTIPDTPTPLGMSLP